MRLFDFDARMCALARLFFPDETLFGSSTFGLRAWGRWLLMLSPLCRTPIDSGCTSTQVCLATMEAKRIRAATRRPVEAAGARRDVLLRRTAPTGAFREGDVFAENVVCESFVATLKALFPDSVHEVIDSGRFTAEHRKRAYFASPKLDLTKLTELDGGCTLEEWFKLDAKNGPCEMRSGSSGTKESTTWHSAARRRRAPTLTSNGLIARNVRTGEVRRVPTKAMEALRGLPALPPMPKAIFYVHSR